MASPERPDDAATPRRPRTMHEARAEAAPGTTLVGVIGSPVAHSLSPLLHEAAFGALGLGGTWRSFAFEVAPGKAAEALDDMRREGIAGLSVTMPHKADVAALVDESSDVARRLGAVNCVTNQRGVLYGTNTDGEGFVASLARGAAFDPAGRHCLVIGAGGAARAVVLALAQAGASEVAVVNRTPGRAVQAAALADRAGTVVAPDEASVRNAVVAADLVVNATPVGMDGVDDAAQAWLVPPALLAPEQLVVDLVYAPRPTRWLREAAAIGATTLDGLGMLVHQAAAQLRRWTDVEPPVEAMWRAAEAAETT